jgi:hypothetical protein
VQETDCAASEPRHRQKVQHRHRQHWRLPGRRAWLAAWLPGWLAAWLAALLVCVFGCPSAVICRTISSRCQSLAHGVIHGAPTVQVWIVYENGRAYPDYLVRYYKGSRDDARTPYGSLQEAQAKLGKRSTSAALAHATISGETWQDAPEDYAPAPEPQQP